MSRAVGEFSLRSHVQQATPRRRSRAEPVFWLLMGVFLGMVATAAIVLIGSGVFR